MESADPSTPAPTYGRSASSRRPCTVPSSPKVPCSTGNTTSISGCAPGSGRIGAGRHFPSLLMKYSTISYFERSIAFMIDSADLSEISCSPLRPPKMTATRSFIKCRARGPECLRRESQDLFPQSRHHQLNRQVRRPVDLINYWIYLDHLHRHQVPRIADHFHCQMRLAIGCT